MGERKQHGLHLDWKLVKRRGDTDYHRAVLNKWFVFNVFQREGHYVYDGRGEHLTGTQWWHAARKVEGMLRVAVVEQGIALGIRTTHCGQCREPGVQVVAIRGRQEVRCWRCHPNNGTVYDG